MAKKVSTCTAGGIEYTGSAVWPVQKKMYSEQYTVQFGFQDLLFISVK